MSRVTRSQAVADENAAPKEGLFRAFAKRGSAPGGTTKPSAPPPVVPPNKAPINSRKQANSRAALGDISNQLQTKPTSDLEQLPKKKRLEDVAEPREYTEVLDEDDVEKAEPGLKHECLNQQAASVHDDVDMRQEEEQRSLEDSVADMKLAEFDADASNPQCVPEYINDIMAHLFETEVKRMASPNYMQRQTDVNTKMREILIDWLVEVHLKFKLRPETLYLTVNFIDRFLERRSVARTRLQLVGCAALLMAAKYEEIYAPEVRDLVYISDQAYTKEQILSMESIMLNTLGFYLTVPTILRFGERLCRVGKVSAETENCVRYLMELTLQDAKFLKYRPSEVAAAAAYLGLKMTGQNWDATLEHHAGYDRARLNDVLVDLQELASRDPPKYRAVRKKYLQKKFLEVSKIPVCPL